MTLAGRIHVAVAVLYNEHGEVLISRRHKSAHQGGLWEFPGGKVKYHEEVYEALSRELMEELNIMVQSTRALIQVPHDYIDRRVLLDVWLVTRWTGTPSGMEGQKITWVSPKSLQNYAFPAADIPIIMAICLPDTYLITPEPDLNIDSFLEILDQCLSSGIRLVQLRAKRLDNVTYEELAKKVLMRCNAKGAKCLLNANPLFAKRIGMNGVHLNSRQLLSIESIRDQYQGNSFSRDGFLVGASCHNRTELDHACRIGADFATLSPIKPTKTHPDAKLISWDQFAALSQASTIPVYALGGMSKKDLRVVWEKGGQGIAAIRSLWLGIDCNRKQ
uniref:8-oxo-dGTP diphosphatase n=1 Tax=Candidatus Kentrum sp. TUN TaxID=2126343 RepID=A0A450ZNC7_9GAMM|nr:MAG: 8-oxo-dGTPase [Candidatus Kentron sp. TUN]VFK55319.1 MAG: 8-oxo-dGTPase [Candidatus Kentron sp. TUN]